MLLLTIWGGGVESNKIRAEMQTPLLKSIKPVCQSYNVTVYAISNYKYAYIHTQNCHCPGWMIIRSFACQRIISAGNFTPQVQKNTIRSPTQSPSHSPIHSLARTRNLPVHADARTQLPLLGSPYPVRALRCEIIRNHQYSLDWVEWLQYNYMWHSCVQTNRPVFHHCTQSTVSLNFHLGLIRDAQLCRSCCMYTVRMCPALNGTLEIQSSERSDIIE